MIFTDINNSGQNKIKSTYLSKRDIERNVTYNIEPFPKICRLCHRFIKTNTKKTLLHFFFFKF